MAHLLPFRDINVHGSTSHYAFTSPSTPSAPTLVIERPSGDIRLNDGSLIGAKRVSSIAGILGIIKLKLDKYVIVITKAQPMGRIRGHMVYKVVATEFLPLRERPVHDPDEDTYLSYLKALLISGPMYFSYSFDVTSSFQRQSESDLSQPLWKRADDRFFWNRFVQTDLIDFRMGDGRSGGLRGQQQPGIDPYILPVMFGMFEIKPARIKSTNFNFALITRRSRHRGGTRYFSRGIDDQGHVANFNETEQVVVLNDVSGPPAGYAGGAGIQNGKVGDPISETQVLSFVQTRGSVPVFWAEINDLRYVPRLQIRGVDTAVEAARKHFEEQIRIYGENYLVNLVNARGREERVKKAYEQIIRILVNSPGESVEADQRTDEKFRDISAEYPQSMMDKLHYIYFDFHNETKGLKWHRAELLLDELIDGLRKGQYFKGVEMPGDPSGALEVRLKQKAVVRTNCMDCLDRTNVVQSMLARWALTQQFQDLGILQPGERVSDDRAFEFLFRNIWADNADVVSKSYSGTGALKTDFTRTGTRTRVGMLQDLSNSCTRYIRNNFLDGPRQDGFDLFLGAYLPSTYGVGTSMMFTDKRPLIVQAIPYVFAASLFIVIISLFTRRAQDSTVWPLRLLVILCLMVAGWSFQFLYTYGLLYVNWPKLNTPSFAIEEINQALARAHKDKIIGPLIAATTTSKERRARNISTANMGYMEEGKKRIE
ncbi:Phosphoinositide phosphatase sac1 [Exophiala dermatitidis]|uniref:Phosphoinositide phosphatase sac1 n=1 Tax=Exophiala dermatitidis TaxID=5970 RepID=A0AAN6ELM3_EXODE|nr:Phosphoinositide phosphatase sac1 [Exophiala dermatitidis]KAJ4506368.1 Phosphoinositide phosphatase sac1 [Exophiala dermatitidis]KAJ4506949.1 Phosphoinositide phosphatase sac1 [Exophiala dermatitidis]KAJ4547951.1 Phosphoinositide phosphatase sac1 [Exophiala dermatitidis]KAJ4553892.1 Phosphoinositide phosphatase sac1 [Exophiala dermatitidis]